MANRSGTDVQGRIAWAIITLLCLAGLATLYLWTNGDLFSRFFDRGTLWERFNGIVAIGSLVGLSILGSYRALRSSNRATNGS